MANDKALVKKVFENLCDAMGKRVAHGYNDVGALQLDYNSVYGGYQIQEIDNVHGGVRTPFGDRRMKASAFLDSMWFAMKCLREAGK